MTPRPTLPLHLAPGDVPAPPPRPRGWTRLAVATAPARRFLVAPVWRLLARLVARPLVVEGRERIPAGPVVFAASHASHADTVVLLAALRGRSVLPAAAADYFFTGRGRGLAAVLGVGAFPFPRAGRDGLDRARAVLAAGHDVLLFPQGTRDGGPVRPGVGALCRDGATVVPVRVAGTDRVLPKGARRPRRHAVEVVVGSPVAAGTPTDRAARQVADHLRLPVAPTTSREAA